MPDSRDVIQRALGADRQLVTVMDLFRAGDFRTVVLSGANNYTSGQAVYSVVASSIVIGRPVNIAIHNRETSHMTFLFRDGGISGTIFAGPYRVEGRNQLRINPDELLGRRFVSGIYAVVISGTFSAGMDLTVSFVLEPNPNAIGGYIE